LRPFTPFHSTQGATADDLWQSGGLCCTEQGIYPCVSTGFLIQQEKKFFSALSVFSAVKSLRSLREIPWVVSKEVCSLLEKHQDAAQWALIRPIRTFVPFVILLTFVERFIPGTSSFVPFVEKILLRALSDPCGKI
jgi:hypothetical protein